MLLSVYSVLITLAWVGVTIYAIVYTRKVKYLKDVLLERHLPEPSVDVVIAVRNEEAELEQALGSVCGLDYPYYRVIAVNDRSTDRTPDILQRMAVRYPALQVLTINELPGGWLGKNNALYQGYRASSAEWLLFTDADVVFAPRALKKAIHYAASNKLDHLVTLPQITSRSQLFKSVVDTFAFMLEVRQRPWAVGNPSSSASLGVGAFNLVRRTAYEKAGTHSALSLRPDDDLKLGKRIKQSGLRQGVVYGDGEVSLQWYASLPQFIQGLMKNTFSIANYQWPLALGMALATLVVFVLPVPLMLLMGAGGSVLALVILAAHIALMLFKKGTGKVWWHGLMVPFAGAVMVYIILAATIKTLWQGGIYWRGHFYPLDELRKHR